MSTSMYRWIKPCLLMAFLFIITTIFLKVSVTNNYPSLRKTALASECRIIQHSLGETCVPLKPQRIIALDIAAIVDPLLSLGIKPVGMADDGWGGRRYFSAALPEEVVGIELVSNQGVFYLEKILILKPDLILINDHQKQHYKLLSMIAPTVVIDIYGVNADIKENFQHIAELVGQEEKAREVFRQYQRRIIEIQKRLGKRLEDRKIGIIYHYNGSFVYVPGFAPPYQVLKDIGLSASVQPGKDEWFTFSIEVIDQYDTGILFIIDNPETSNSYLSQQPLILSLEAAKNGQAYIVSPKIWEFYGPIGMNLFLDDLAKYLLKGKQDPHFE